MLEAVVILSEDGSDDAVVGSISGVATHASMFAIARSVVAVALEPSLGLGLLRRGQPVSSVSHVEKIVKQVARTVHGWRWQRRLLW